MKYEAACVLSLLLIIVCVAGQVQLRHRWRTPVFAYPDAATRQALIANGTIVENTGYILDVDRDLRGRTFVTLPRFDNGSAVTLATVVNNNQVDNPLLQPYPNWSWHQRGNCNGLTSVFRMKIDQCNRLWALDSGVVDVFDSFNQACPPKLMVFDLNTNTLIKRYIFPDNVLDDDTLFITIEVETDVLCRNTYAYVADVGAFKLIVYSLDNDRSWSVNSSAFYPDPNYVNFDIAGQQFELADGLFALTLGPRNWLGDRRLFFHSLASNCESSVSTSLLKNERNFASGPNAIDNRIAKCIGRRTAQSAAEAMDSNGNLFSSDLTQNAINYWNSNTRFSERQVAQNDTTLQFISGMKVVRSWSGEEVLAISSRFQMVVTSGMDRNEYNFHIVSGSAPLLIRNSGSQGWSWLPF